MGYYVRALKNKQSLPNWKIQFLSYKKKDTVNSISKKPRREWDIPKKIMAQTIHEVIIPGLREYGIKLSKRFDAGWYEFIGFRGYNEFLNQK